MGKDRILEIRLTHKPVLAASSNEVWHDVSNTETHVFESHFGQVRLRRRAGFPTTYAIQNGPLLYIGYGDPNTIISEAAFLGSEFLIIIIDCAAGTLTVQRDALSTLPLFIGTEPDKVVLSNSYEYVYQNLNPQLLEPDHQTIAAMLDDRNENKTVFKNIQVLYDRMRADWSKAGLDRQLAPSNYLRDYVRDHPGDPKEFFKHFESNLDTYWQRYCSDGTLAGIEVSGGLDSTAIAGYYASHNRGFLPISLTYGDEFQTSIQTKLDDLQQRFNLFSQRFPMDPRHDYPLAHILQGNEARPFYTADDIYVPSTTQMAEYLQSQGATVVFRGVGGDELFEHYTEAFDQANGQTTLPLLSRSIAAAGLKASNTYIERGIWPILPLADPELYYYCQSLPLRHRHNRDILRAYLHARTYPASIYAPTVNEHFGPFFSQAVTANLTTVFYDYMRHSVLGDMGLIDTQQSVKLWVKAAETENQKDLYKLYVVLCIEINLQHWRQRLAQTPTI